MSDAAMPDNPCECGCGEDAGHYSMNSSNGRAGRPKRFVPGHHNRRTEPQAICFVDGCETFASSRGLCPMHYSRLRKRGDLGGAEPQRVQNEGQTCAADDCVRAALTRGYCRRHYYYVNRYGVPERPVKPTAPPVVYPPNPCQCGCGEDAGVYATSNSHAGIVAGTPKSFLHGHHNRLPEYQHQAPPFDECYTVQADGCWRWTAGLRGDDGYGAYRSEGRTVSAHRYAYERLHGPIPDDSVLRVDHMCHDPKTCKGGTGCPHRACVNPDHLQLVTHAENCRRGANAKVTAEQAADIRRRRAAGERGVDLAREYNVGPTAISWIARGLTWKEG